MLLNGRSSKLPGETVFFTKVAPEEGLGMDLLLKHMMDKYYLQLWK